MRAVIPSVDYADFLAVTLPGWRRVLPDAHLVVVTAPRDVETQAVARQHGVACLVTDAWYQEGAHFDKARAMDQAFGFDDGDRRSLRPPDPGEVCLALDADGYPFGALPPVDTIRAGAIYGCARYHCPSPLALEAHQAGRTARAALALIPPKVRGVSYGTIANTAPNVEMTASRALGFFQLWRHAPGLRFGSHRTAGKYDLDFRNQFAYRIGLRDLYVLHLGDQDRRNWHGRVLPRWGVTA